MFAEPVCPQHRTTLSEIQEKYKSSLANHLEVIQVPFFRLLKRWEGVYHGALPDCKGFASNNKGSRAFARRGRRSERRPAAPSFASYLPADALKRAAAARQKNDYRNAIAERRQAVSLRPD